MESEINISRNKKPFNKLLLLIPLTFIPIIRVGLKNFETNIALSVSLFLYCLLMFIFFVNALKKNKKNTTSFNN